MAPSAVTGTTWVELCEILNFIHSLRVRLERSFHFLEIGLFAWFALCVNGSLNGLVQLSQEHIEALDVRLNNFKLEQAFILRVFLSFGLSAFSIILAKGSGKVLVLHEADIMAILLIADTNLLEEILDGHEDDTMLVRLLQTHLSLLLVADHQLCLICLNLL